MTDKPIRSPEMESLFWETVHFQKEGEFETYKLILEGKINADTETAWAIKEMMSCRNVKDANNIDKKLTRLINSGAFTDLRQVLGAIRIEHELKEIDDSQLITTVLKSDPEFDIKTLLDIYEQPFAEHELKRAASWINAGNVKNLEEFAEINKIEDILNKSKGKKHTINGIAGRGNSQIVYDVKDEHGKRTALKVPLTNVIDSISHANEKVSPKERASRAMKAAVSIPSHPNIVLPKDAFELIGKVFYEEEFIEGAPLDKLLSDFSIEKKMRLFGDMLKGAEHLHKYGYIVRDIKLNNVMYNEKEDIAQLNDLEFIKKQSEIDDGTTGTSLDFRHNAPEIHAGKSITLQSDLYRLGECLYTLITKKDIIDPKTDSVPITSVTDKNDYNKILKEKIKKVEQSLESEKISSRKRKIIINTLESLLQQDTENRSKSATDVLANFLKIKDRIYHKKWFIPAVLSGLLALPLAFNLTKPVINDAVSQYIDGDEQELIEEYKAVPITDADTASIVDTIMMEPACKLGDKIRITIKNKPGKKVKGYLFYHDNQYNATKNQSKEIIIGDEGVNRILIKAVSDDKKCQQIERCVVGYEKDTPQLLGVSYKGNNKYLVRLFSSDGIDSIFPKTELISYSDPTLTESFYATLEGKTKPGKFAECEVDLNELRKIEHVHEKNYSFFFRLTKGRTQNFLSADYEFKFRDVKSDVRLDFPSSSLDVEGFITTISEYNPYVDRPVLDEGDTVHAELFERLLRGDFYKEFEDK